MLVKPAIADETITACLLAEYGLPVIALTFLPLGGDLDSAVYRATAQDGAAYFCKLRRDFDPLAVELPRFLYDQGIAEIIPPLVTRSGGLWAGLAEFTVVLYPFVEGTSGFEQALTERQWSLFGQALKRVHTTALPGEMRARLAQEDFGGERREACRAYLRRLEQERFDDPVRVGLAAYLLERQERVRNQLAWAEKLAQRLAAHPPDFVLCHNDIHPGNLFLEQGGGLYLVDWDYPILAPKERDLMFIGGGQGYVGCSGAADEEQRFYRHYGAAEIDPEAMAYYRCERNIYDLTVECGRVLSDELGEAERRQSLEIVTWLFLPGGSIEIAEQAVG